MTTLVPFAILNLILEDLVLPVELTHTQKCVCVSQCLCLCLCLCQCQCQCQCQCHSRECRYKSCDLMYHLFYPVHSPLNMLSTSKEILTPGFVKNVTSVCFFIIMWKIKLISFIVWKICKRQQNVISILVWQTVPAFWIERQRTLISWWHGPWPEFLKCFESIYCTMQLLLWVWSVSTYEVEFEWVWSLPAIIRPWI